MNRNYKISIPEPCTEDWNKMTPNEDGRFCSSCSKNVVDFTNKLPDEIQVYFQHNSNVCGRFKNFQLDSLTIQISNRILHSQTQYLNIFLLALFITMGTTLFSCQTKNGDRQKIDKVEVVEDTLVKHTTMGVILPPKNDLNNVTTKKTKFVKQETIKCDEVISKKDEKINTETPIFYEDNVIYGPAGISVYPEYKGGITPFYKYIKQNFIFNKRSKQLSDTLIATFIIEKDGKLDSINISKDLGFGTKEELIRILSSSQKWYPGEVNGKKRNCKFQLLLTIKPDTIKKSFFRTKTASKIDTIEINRISKY
jgi:hypothetical protein